MRSGKTSTIVLMTLVMAGALTLPSLAGAIGRDVDYINNPSETSAYLTDPAAFLAGSSTSADSSSSYTDSSVSLPDSVSQEQQEQHASSAGSDVTENAEQDISETGAVTMIDGIRVPANIKSDPDIQTELSTLTGGGANIDWGNYYPSPNAAPVGNADEGWLRTFGAYSKEITGEKICYLTFDLGYENGLTMSIMETLKKHNAPGTFFVTGACIKSNPDIVLTIAKNGFTVGNHTLSHKNMSNVTTKEMFYTELKTVEEQYEALTGHPMNRYYRPPEGKSSQAQLMLARAMGYKTILWSVAYKDYDEKAQPDRSSALATLNKRIHPGAIVLLHATSSTNASILDELLTGWESAGYTFRSLDELP